MPLTMKLRGLCLSAGMVVTSKNEVWISAEATPAFFNPSMTALVRAVFSLKA
jgi:hypothetical protein